MAVFVISDTHLSLGKADKPMDIFGDKWAGHAEKIRRNWLEAIGPEDTVVIPGDISWALKTEDSLDDMRFLDALPGRKIIGKGNHDYWWGTCTKMRAFLRDNGIGTIEFLYNNAFRADGLIICGSRLWDGVGTNSAPEDLKAYAREVGRLRTSLLAGTALRETEGGEIAAFTHYPPWASNDGRQEYMELLAEFGVKRCYYGHLHGPAIASAVEGECRGVELRLVSADHLDFVPLKISAY